MLLLEKLDVLLAKMSEEEIRTDILPLTFAMLESNSIQGQVSSTAASLSAQAAPQGMLDMLKHTHV